MPGLDIPARMVDAVPLRRALNALIEEALKANPEHRNRQGRLAPGARADVYAERGRVLPDGPGRAAAHPGRNKTRDRRHCRRRPPPANPYYSLYTTQLTVSYMPDVFGGTRRQVEALAATEEGQRFQLEAAYLTLTGNLVAAAVQRGGATRPGRRDRGHHQNRSATRSTSCAGNWRSAQRGGRGCRGAAGGTGAGGGGAAAAQETGRAAAPSDRRADRPATCRARTPAGAVRNLAGRCNAAGSADVSLPSKLVEHRPDIRAAEANLHAASAEIGVAIANMLPQITLSGNLRHHCADQIGQPVYRARHGVLDRSAGTPRRRSSTWRGPPAAQEARRRRRV